MKLEKFIKKAKKKKLFTIRISKGLFKYCDEQRYTYRVEYARYIKLNAGKKLCYFTHWPENWITKEELNTEYENLINEIMNKGLLIYDWLPRDYYKKT